MIRIRIFSIYRKGKIGSKEKESRSKHSKTSIDSFFIEGVVLPYSRGIYVLFIPQLMLFDLWFSCSWYMYIFGRQIKYVIKMVLGVAYVDLYIAHKWFPQVPHPYLQAGSRGMVILSPSKYLLFIYNLKIFFVTRNTLIYFI
jgi:hypothetical protein